MDECPKQLIGETRVPIPAKPGQTACFDTEYVRNGTCDIFMFAAPLEGRRRAEVTERRTGKDWAEQIKKPADEDFPEAEKIVLVMDNLNTHAIASLYETYPAQEVKRIRDKLELHYTPKHGTRLNTAEIARDKQAGITRAGGYAGRDAGEDAGMDRSTEREGE
jgi:hypothetical protein